MKQQYLNGLPSLGFSPFDQFMTDDFFGREVLNPVIDATDRRFIDRQDSEIGVFSPATDRLPISSPVIPQVIKTELAVVKPAVAQESNKTPFITSPRVNIAVNPIAPLNIIGNPSPGFMPIPTPQHVQEDLNTLTPTPTPVKTPELTAQVQKNFMVADSAPRNVNAASNTPPSEKKNTGLIVAATVVGGIILAMTLSGSGAKPAAKKTKPKAGLSGNPDKAAGKKSQKPKKAARVTFN